jgi:cardiolipin synthase
LTSSAPRRLSERLVSAGHRPFAGHPAISVLIYVLTTRAEHERRPPSIAIAWVLGMIAVPYLALPMYLMFGRRKLPRKLLRGPGSRALRALGRRSDREFRLGAGSRPRCICTATAANRRPRCSRPWRPPQAPGCVHLHPRQRRVRPRGDAAHDRAGAQRRAVVRLLLDGVGAIQLPRACFKEAERRGRRDRRFSVPCSRARPRVRAICATIAKW